MKGGLPRNGAIVIGLVVVIALVIGTGTTGFAGNGDPFKLGQKNTANKLSSLVAKVASDAALLVRNSGDGPALDLRVGSEQPPLTVNSSTVVTNLNADQVDGKHAGAFVSADTYKKESAVAQGRQLGDGTFVMDQGCDPGDVVLSGGPANIRATSTVLESLPSPGQTRSWTVRINTNGQSDEFSIVVLCGRQP